MEEIHFETGGATYTYRPTHADHDLFRALADDRCHEELGLLIAPFASPENPRVLPRTRALAAAGRIVEVITTDRFLPFHYSNDFEVMPGYLLKKTTGATGLRLADHPGCFFSLKCGKGFCMLFENSQLKDNHRPLLSLGTDLRQASELTTASHGTIPIHRKRWSLPTFATTITVVGDFFAASLDNEVRIHFQGYPP